MQRNPGNDLTLIPITAFTATLAAAPFVNLYYQSAEIHTFHFMRNPTPKNALHMLLPSKVKKIKKPNHEEIQ